MKRLIPLVIAGFIAATGSAIAAEEAPPDPIFLTDNPENLDEFVWRKRPIVVFAASPNDPAFIEQMDLLRARPAALEERDVVVLADTDPTNPSPLRKKLRPRGFMLVIIGKDGGVKLRKPFPWDVREISRSIDKMPMRQREIREAKEAD